MEQLSIAIVEDVYHMFVNDGLCGIEEIFERDDSVNIAFA